MNDRRALTTLAVLSIATASLAGCVPAPSMKVVQMGLPATPREPQCALELRTTVGDAEQVGQILVDDEEERPYNDPALLALIKPEACKLGGEFVSGASQSFNDGITRKSHNLYIVWHHKTTPSGPVPF